ncbi:MAG: efflux RND transporter periplasmic adaptor subunit [Planctomycetia bacterium]|nr:efflux RND transporter periplasmic adaptor subunit [Planctomycetia bacterium]
MKSLLPVCLLIFTPFLTSCDSEPPVIEETIRPIPAIQVGEFKEITGRKFPGRAKATQEANLSFDVSGKLIERPIDIGDAVKQGDVIARLNPRDFKAKVKSTRAELVKVKRNLARGKQLVEKEFISQFEYDRLVAAVDVAEAELEVAQKALSDSVIKAPFDGHIANTYVENFQAVLSKTVIARLLDTSQIEMVIQIPENIISKVPYIEDIHVTFDAFPDVPLAATVKEVSNEASETTRTYYVNLIMPQSDKVKILPGMAGNATGVLRMPGEADELKKLVIPVYAVFTPNTMKQDHVWVIDKETGSVKIRKIKTDRLTQSGIQVIDGLQAGEWIAIAGVHTLREGQKVRIDSSIVAE